MIPVTGAAQGFVPNLDGMVLPGIELPKEAMPQLNRPAPIVTRTDQNGTPLSSTLSRGGATMTRPSTTATTLGETLARGRACDAMISNAFLSEEEKISCRSDKAVYKQGAQNAVEGLTPLYTAHLEQQRDVLSTFGTDDIHSLREITPESLSRIVSLTPNQPSLYEGTKILLDDIVFVNWGEIDDRDRGYELWTSSVPAGPTGEIGTGVTTNQGMNTAPGRGSMGPRSSTVSVFYLSPSFGQVAQDISEACLQFSFTETPCSGVAEVSANAFEATYYPEIRSVAFDPFTDTQSQAGLTHLLVDPFAASEASERAARMEAMSVAILKLIEMR
jgi:hypothetical protein